MRVFKYDKKRNALIVQSVIMIVIAFFMFYSFYHLQQILYFVLLAFAIAFLGIYFYRMFFMKFIFDDQSVTFKGLAKQYKIDKASIHSINILYQIGRQVKVKEYKLGEDMSLLANKVYIMIKANDKPLNTNISMFNAATDDYITLEYIPGIEKYLDLYLEK